MIDLVYIILNIDISVAKLSVDPSIQIYLTKDIVIVQD